MGTSTIPISQMRKPNEKRWSYFTKATQLVNKGQAQSHTQPGCRTTSLSTLPGTSWPWCPEWVTPRQSSHSPQPGGRECGLGAARGPSSQLTMGSSVLSPPRGAGQCCHFPVGPEKAATTSLLCAVSPHRWHLMNAVIAGSVAGVVVIITATGPHGSSCGQCQGNIF